MARSSSNRWAPIAALAAASHDRQLHQAPIGYSPAETPVILERQRTATSAILHIALVTSLLESERRPEPRREEGGRTYQRFDWQCPFIFCSFGQQTDSCYLAKRAKINY